MESCDTPGLLAYYVITLPLSYQATGQRHDVTCFRDHSGYTTQHFPEINHALTIMVCSGRAATGLRDKVGIRPGIEPMAGL